MTEIKVEDLNEDERHDYEHRMGMVLQNSNMSEDEAHKIAMDEIKKCRECHRKDKCRERHNGGNNGIRQKESL